LFENFFIRHKEHNDYFQSKKYDSTKESVMIYKFELGSFDLIAVSDGVFSVDREFFFGHTPHHLIKDYTDPFDAALNFLFIDTGNKKILVDTGLGISHQPLAGRLVEHLAAESIYPEDIDMVIITHGHMDHIGGASHEGYPTYPNAQYVISLKEWSYWKARPESDEFKKLLLLEKQLLLIDSDKELVPGVHLIHTPGHTPGHLSISLTSLDRTLLIASDILSDPIALKHLPSHIRAELAPEQGLATRKKFLQDAHDRSALLFVCHYPFPGLGQAVPDDGSWRWVPIGMSPFIP
jgi:glyoxylase-like metal-dependent hydrolase (beta-lactamase superfamily II)